MNANEKYGSGKWQFGVRMMLIVILVFAIGLGWLSYRRARNSDQLKRVLDDAGPEKVEVAEVSDPPPNNWVSKLLANSASKPIELRFFGLSKQQCEDLQQNLATDQIKSLSLVTYHPDNKFFNGLWRVDNDVPESSRFPRNMDEPFTSEHSPMFFEHWPSLERLVIRDTAIPEAWFELMSSLPKLQEVVISGGLCNVEPEHFANVKTLKRMVLCHRGITSDRLADLKKLMPQVHIDLLGSFESRLKSDNAAPLSRHDEDLYQRMKKLLAEIDAEIVKAGGTNTVPGPPSTEAQIAKLEIELGSPLPPSLRAFYEVSDGWPKAPCLIWDGIGSTEKLLERYSGRLALAFRPNEYDFTPLGFDQFANPNGLPIANDRGLLIHNDRMCHLDPGGEGGPWGQQEFDLFGCLEQVLANLRANRDVEIYKGRIHVYVDLK